MLGEAFIKYQDAADKVVLRRQEIPNYMFVSTSNIRMTPITHEGLIFENTALDSFAFHAGYITQMKERNSDIFIDMATGARLKAFVIEGDGTNPPTQKDIIRGDYDPSHYDASGSYVWPSKEMGLLGVNMKFGNFHAKVWDYYVEDFVNTVYVYADYLLPLEASSWHYAAQYGKQGERWR